MTEAQHTARPSRGMRLTAAALGALGALALIAKVGYAAANDAEPGVRSSGTLAAPTTAGNCPVGPGNRVRGAVCPRPCRRPTLMRPRARCRPGTGPAAVGSRRCSHPAWAGGLPLLDVCAARPDVRRRTSLGALGRISGGGRATGAHPGASCTGSTTDRARHVVGDSLRRRADSRVAGLSRLYVWRPGLVLGRPHGIVTAVTILRNDADAACTASPRSGRG